MPRNPLIPLFKPFVAEETLSHVEQTLRSGYIGEGPRVQEFEHRLGCWLGNPNLLTTNSATSALHLIFHMLRCGEGWDEAGSSTVSHRLRIESGDEALTSPLTCVATNWPLLANGIRPRWVDVDATNCNMDPASLRDRISPRTKIIVVVHWGGYPADLDGISEVAAETRNRYGFTPVIIEDCAHAFGSSYNGKLLGNHGNPAVFSFQAVKILTAVDGGLLVLPSRTICERARRLRWYGIDRANSPLDQRHEQDIVEWGFKFNMNDVAASIGLANLPYVGGLLRTARENSSFYSDSLIGCPGVTLLSSSDAWSSSCYLYTLLAERRLDLQRKLAEHGIEARSVHRRNDLHSCVKEYRTDLAVLDEIHKRIICIPVGWWVSPEDREHVANMIKEGW